MGRETIEGIVTVALAIVGVGFVATLVSRNAQTPAVIGAGGSAFATALTAAEGPVLGGGGGSYMGTIGWTGSAPYELPSY